MALLRQIVCCSTFLLIVPFACSTGDEGYFIPGTAQVPKPNSDGGSTSSSLFSANGGNAKTGSLGTGAVGGGGSESGEIGTQDPPRLRGGAAGHPGTGGFFAVAGAASNGGVATAAGSQAIGGMIGAAGTTKTHGGDSSTPSVQRNCTSDKDNDGNSLIDKDETTYCKCQGPTSCTTSSPGECAVGTRACVFSADKTTSDWGACVAPPAKTRDCRSQMDFDCDGRPDNTQPECKDCGLASPRACNTHPEDGIGTCKAGTQSLSIAPDHSSCSWGPCTGDVEPTAGELCGPNSQDLNCDGIRGNGACAITVHVYVKDEQHTACSCNDNRPNYVKNAVAATSSPGSGWTELTSFKVFTGPQPLDTVPLLNCTDTQYAPSNRYIAIGHSCPGGSLVGYVSTSQAPGYVQLKVLSTESCGQPSFSIPLGPDSSASGEFLFYYTVP
jgi:hypothetical protein